MVELTGPQRSLLRFLDTRPGPLSWRDPNLRHRIGMLRRMEERFLVGRNSHGQWYISAAGRAAFLKATQHQEKK
jgi:hypothetical protein